MTKAFNRMSVCRSRNLDSEDERILKKIVREASDRKRTVNALSLSSLLSAALSPGVIIPRYNQCPISLFTRTLPDNEIKRITAWGSLCWKLRPSQAGFWFNAFCRLFFTQCFTWNIGISLPDRAICQSSISRPARLSIAIGEVFKSESSMNLVSIIDVAFHGWKGTPL